MGIFSNFKINSLRKKVIEGKYELRLEGLASSLKNLPENQRIELAADIAISLKVNFFAKTLICWLFHPDSGVFKDDVWNLNEDNFDRLYQTIVVWYCWIEVPLTPEGIKNPGGLNNFINSIETCLNISHTQVEIYLINGLAKLDPSLVNFTLYRWGMLTVGHADIFYESLHENSPDCKKFIGTINLAKEEAEKYWDKK